jgi:hypothetical protein
MRRRLSIRGRLERLETVLRKETTTPAREAFVEMLSEAVGERHLVMTSPAGAAPCWFQERVGPGRGIERFWRVRVGFISDNRRDERVIGFFSRLKVILGPRADGP